MHASDEVLVALIIGPARDFIGSWYKLRAADAKRAASAMRDARKMLPVAAWASVSPVRARP
jgi:hypothetical protein